MRFEKRHDDNIERSTAEGGKLSKMGSKKEKENGSDQVGWFVTIIIIIIRERGTVHDETIGMSNIHIR